MQIVFPSILLLLLHIVAFSLAFPASPRQNNSSNEASDGGSLRPDLSLRASPPLIAPPRPLPYRFKVSDDGPYYILFGRYGRPVSRHLTDILLYRYMSSLNRVIRDDPRHGLVPMTGHHALEEGSLVLAFSSPHPSSLRAGGLWLYIDALSRFFKQYGYVECSFTLEYGDGRGGSGRVAVGSLKND